MADIRNTKRGLEMRTRRYRNMKTGHSITLIGVIHLAHPSFWKNTERKMISAARDGVVHYEAVRKDDSGKTIPAHIAERIEKLKTLSAASTIGAKLTGLMFQKDGIDYTGNTSWKNVDLTVVEVAESLDSDTLKKTAEELENLTKDITQEQQRMLGKAFLFMFRHFALINRAVGIKKLLNPSMLDKVILEKRNRYAMHYALKEKKPLTLVWGAAHLSGMGKILERAGYSLVGQDWELAIPADYKLPDTVTLEDKTEAVDEVELKTSA
jgi:hypothetical protein